MGVIANPRSYSKRVQSYECRMLCKINARHNDEESDEENLQSTDNACFAWSVVTALYPADRTKSYPHYTSVLNFDDIEFPMILKNIEKFEHLNIVSINIYGIEKQKVLSIRLTDNKEEKHVCSVVRARSSRWKRGPFYQKSILACELATEQTQEQEIFYRDR